MTSRRNTTGFILITCMIVASAALALASRAPTKPLAERLAAADTVFVGVVTNKVVDGEWVRADLLVETPLRNAKQGKKVEVIWRATVDGMPIYDTAAGTKRIAILDDKHEGRYWLRDDKFEDLANLAKVKKLIIGSAARSRKLPGGS